MTRGSHRALVLLLAACTDAGTGARPADVTATWVADRAATPSARLVDSLELRADGTGKWSRDLYYRGERSPEGTTWSDTAHRQFPPMALRWHVRGAGAQRALCTYNVVQEDSTCAPMTRRPDDTLTVGDITYRRMPAAAAGR